MAAVCVEPSTGAGPVKVCTSGVFPCYVKGPVSAGDQLTYEKSSETLIKGDTGSFKALADVGAGTTTLAPVSIGAGAGGGGGGGLSIARVASTANIAALSGTPTIDGVVLVAGDVILAKDQSTAAQNGTYTVAAGAWTKIEQPTEVYVKLGNYGTTSRWTLTSANTYTRTSRSYWAASAVATTLAYNADGVTVSAGQRQLVIGGASKGVWIRGVATSDWQKEGEPSPVGVVGGTVYGRQTFVTVPETGTGSYVQTYGVWAP